MYGVVRLWEKIVAEAMSGWMRKHWLWITSPKGRVVGRKIPPDLPACVALSKCRESKKTDL